MHKSRITRGEDFQRIFREGIRVGGQYVVTHAVFACKEAEPKIGFIVSKRVGNAVKRNLVRRRLQGIAREIKEQLINGNEYIFRAKPNATQADYVALKQDLEKQITKINSRVPQ